MKTKLKEHIFLFCFTKSQIGFNIKLKTKSETFNNYPTEEEIQILQFTRIN